jgi:DNA-binding NarL/FixJ family response regulator
MTRLPHRAKTKARIAIVDDHPIMLKGMIALIDDEPDMEVCGCARSESEAIDAIAKTKPDLVIMDVSLGRANGLDLVKRLKALHPKLLVLVLSMHDEQRYALRALRAGARGYVMKSAVDHQIGTAIRCVLAGDVFLSPTIKQKYLDQFLSEQLTGVTDKADSLTNRELDILRHIGEGLTTAQIAAEIGISAKTVETHRLHIKQKLGLAHHIQLVHYAVRWRGEGV